MIDKLVEYFTPGKASARYASRLKNEVLKREYEAASRSRRTRNWNAKRKHTSKEADKNDTIANRARDLTRNDGYAKRGRKILQTYQIGTGITASVKDKNGAKSEELTARFNEWARSVSCDTRQRTNFYGLQSLAVREMITSGEVLVLKQIEKIEKGSEKIPLSLLVLEAEYLDAKKDNGETIIQGVEFQGNKRSQYWMIGANIPGEKSGSANSSPVPAKNVIHMFEEERPGQVRGVSWFAPVVIPMRDLDEYRDAELMRRKVSACFSAFVTSSLDVLSDEEKDSFSKLEPGAIEFLSPGQDIKTTNPPPVSDYEPYTKTEVQKIAAGLGVTYEHLSQNLREVNFSSARVGQIPFQKFIREWQTQLIIPQFLDRVWEWFKEAAILVDGAQWVDASVEWTSPRVEQLDEQKETEALQAKVRAGFVSYSEAIRSIGSDPDKVLAEIIADNASIDAAKMILDTDPRKITKAGILQSAGEKV